MAFDKYPRYESVTWKRRQAAASLEDLEIRVTNALGVTRAGAATQDTLMARATSIPHVLEYIVTTIRAVGCVNAGVAETTGETVLDVVRVQEIREELHHAAAHTQKAVGHLLDGLGYTLVEQCPHMTELAQDSYEQARDSLDAARESMRGAHGMWKALYAGHGTGRCPDE